jgi:redox-sensitive bicupin YhaK (pirin superfamily)
VLHSEHNFGSNVLRFLQIWILPDKKGYPPGYGDEQFLWQARENRWMLIASGCANLEAPIRIHADVNIYAAFIDKNRSLTFKTNAGRQTYMVLTEGAVQAGDIALSMRDALEIMEEDVTIQAAASAHLLVIEMAKA